MSDTHKATIIFLKVFLSRAYATDAFNVNRLHSHICVLLMNKKLSETMVFSYPPVAFSCLNSMAGHLASIIDLEAFVDL